MAPSRAVEDISDPRNSRNSRNSFETRLSLQCSKTGKKLAIFYNEGYFRLSLQCSKSGTKLAVFYIESYYTLITKIGKFCIRFRTVVSVKTK